VLRDVRELQLVTSALDNVRTGHELDVLFLDPSVTCGSIDRRTTVCAAVEEVRHSGGGLRRVAGSRGRARGGLYLIRAFASLEEHGEQEEMFYGSDAWRRGPREAIVALIDSYHTIVIEVSDGLPLVAWRHPLKGQGDRTTILRRVSHRALRRSSYRERAAMRLPGVFGRSPGRPQRRNAHPPRRKIG
jgi:hypothetical protein